MGKMKVGMKYHNHEGPSNIMQKIRCPECNTKRTIEPLQEDTGCLECQAKATQAAAKKAVKKAAEKTEE